VIQSGTTSFQDTTSVRGPVRSVNSDGNGLGLKGSCQTCARSLWDVCVTGDFERSGVDFAFSLDGGVRVLGLKDDTLGHDVFEGVVHQTAIAAVVSVAC